MALSLLPENALFLPALNSNYFSFSILSILDLSNSLICQITNEKDLPFNWFNFTEAPLTLEQHRFELCGSSHTQMFFKKYIGKCCGDFQQFEESHRQTM